jgi:tRNA modification GTPase
VMLTDTAGLRESTDRIETLGVQRTREAIADSDLLIVVMDGAEDLRAEDFDVLEQARNGRHIVAMNKRDEPSFEIFEKRRSAFETKTVKVSAVTGVGLSELRAAILEPFGSVDSSNTGLLLRASNEVQASSCSIKEGMSEELVLIGLHNALRFLGEITGETTTEEILSEIFATFCIGK